MKLYIIHCGTIGMEQSRMVRAREDLGEEAPAGARTEVPVIAALILTPGNGAILYDLGLHPSYTLNGLPPPLCERYDIRLPGGLRLPAQLARLGLAPKDIGTVVISHLHFDHIGYLADFTHADIYAPRADFTRAMTETALTPAPLANGYLKYELRAPVRQYHLVDDDFPLAPGVALINLPGHTPGLLGMVVRLERDGVFLFPGDSLNGPENFGPPPRLPGGVSDSAACFASIERVRELQRRERATVVYSHSREALQGLRLLPEWYE